MFVYRIAVQLRKIHELKQSRLKACNFSDTRTSFYEFFCISVQKNIYHEMLSPAANLVKKTNFLCFVPSSLWEVGRYIPDVNLIVQYQNSGIKFNHCPKKRNKKILKNWQYSLSTIKRKDKPNKRVLFTILNEEIKMNLNPIPGRLFWVI